MGNKTIFLVYGEGGHKAQMNRLLKILELNDCNFVHIVDSDFFIDDTSFITLPLRKKERNNIIFSVFSFFYNFIFAFYLTIKFKPTAVLSTGPAICYPFFCVGKLFGCKTIFLETWSRFYSKSFTSKLVYPIVDFFYYQNIELSAFYPKGKYSGRL